KGISYPQDLCPKDPYDVQCCVEIPCKADGGSGFCRSAKNNGCPGGSFHPGISALRPSFSLLLLPSNYSLCSNFQPWPCPGDIDIQCCIKSDSTPKPPTGNSVGAKVLAQAKTAAGVPYA